MGNHPANDIAEGLERTHKMFPEERVHETKAPKNSIEEMGASGVDMNDVREAVGGRLENILHIEQVDSTSWRLKVRRITRSGNYTETITVTAKSSMLAEGKEASADNDPVYRLTAEEAAQKVAETLGSHLIKVEAIRGDESLLSLHIRENHDTQAVHRIFADLNASLHGGGWHATMREEKRWTISPMAGAFLEKRSTVRAAAKGEHLYPPAHYAGRSTDALLRSCEYRDNVPLKEGGEKEEGTVNESDARKRAFKAGYPMLPQHALAHSTDAVLTPAIGDNDKVKNAGGESNTTKSKKSEGGSSMLSKAVDAKGDFM